MHDEGSHRTELIQPATVEWGVECGRRGDGDGDGDHGEDGDWLRRRRVPNSPEN